ncbi:MAG TPA: GDSL-type esterase/lipase family protein [Pirellulales bacterium]|jgi:lysophospholipase L1-like esterase|nr:GDSL-type esterase/lipase family protein [Pirellulales bacterium]
MSTSFSRRLLLAVGLTGIFVVATGVRAAEPKPVDVSHYKDPIKLACVGDSITEGAGASDPKRGPYPKQLAKLLGDKWDVKNFGVGGATMLKSGDKPYDKQGKYKAALEFKPDVVVLKLGTNDTKPQNWSHKDEFVASAKEIIDAFKKANPHVVIYVCYPVPAFPSNYGIRDEIIKNEVLPLLKEVAADEKTEVIDLYSAMAEHGKLFPDKVHPNDEGYGLIAAAVQKALLGK